MPKYSVKRPFTILVGVVIILVLGFVSFTRMTTDLLPKFSIPYVMVVTTWPGASPDKVKQDVTEPIESSLGTVNGVVNVTSTSSENYGIVTLEFEEDTEIDSAMVKLSTAVDQLTLPEGVGKPMLIEMSMDMLPVLYTSVDYEGKDLYELSDFVEDTVKPELERQNGVASVDAYGAVKKSVEIRLNVKKIEKLNDKLAAHVEGKLDDAKKELDDSKQELKDAKEKLEKSKKDLEKEQDKTAKELGKTSKLLDQAMANKAAYEANLSTLKASKQALQMEKKAYKDAKVEANYKKINETFAQMQEMATGFGMDASAFPADVKDALDNPDKLKALTTYMTSIGQAKAAAGLTEDGLKQMYDIVETRLPQIDTALKNLETEIKAAEAVVKQVNKQVKEASKNYEKVESGKVTAAAGVGSGSAQISDGLNQIESGEEKLKEAEESYKNARDEALKNANLDQLLSLDALSDLISAQNFSMPAGYIYQSKDQFLLKVGEEFSSVDQMKKSVLVKVDGLGDVQLKDVADVTWIDNADDMYTKVNGKDGILLSVSKVSTAGTSTVSQACGDKLEALEKEYKGLSFTNLMDQGDYIGLIVKEVLSNLVTGAILAILVLILFLRAVKPTIVVAFSIPLSVLLAIVLMYFSGITLNIISLSGLALGIGMLVDNSIVVIENIYRLRGEGMPAAKAAVQGAKQVAGAIAASTLTTICVFFPIVFTEGIVKQLFVDMALTITYSLLASLLIALTLVPAMGSTLLKKAEPKPERFMSRVKNVYTKVLAFFLRFKFVPIGLAVVLLVICGYGATKAGLVLLPSMGGEQMTVTMEANKEMDDKAVFALADDVMEKMQKIEGVEYVGIMSGSNSSTGASATMLLNRGGIRNLSIYLLVDEETSKDNSGVAKQLTKICEGLDLEDFNVSTSNMDFSALLSQGLEIDIYGEDTEKLLDISEDIMGMVKEVKGFKNITNGQEDGDETVELTINKNKAMRHGLTVAQIFMDLSENLTTEKTATSLAMDGKEYDVLIVNEDDAVDVKHLMDYEFEVQEKDDDGKEVAKKYKLKEFAKMKKGRSLASIQRDNQDTFVSVTAEPDDGYNTTLLSRDVEKKIASYEVPDGYRVELAGESEEINDAMQKMFFMIALAIVLVYLIMVAQFQSLLSPFIVIFTIPLAFTGGLIGVFISGEDLSLTGMMGFLMLAGIIVNNGIVFVDYANQLRLDGMEKREALLKTGRDRMRPILMTTLTTVLAMCVMLFSTDAAAAMSRGMAVVVIGGLLYATLMTLFIVPVLYDLLFRRKPKRIDVD